ncbi:MAG: hypothetical protein HYZ20_16465 [Burkholderiales bacterium]|nr:hypothetical protein [Burkholderiales bacterium]
MELSRYFSLDEMTRSQTAERHGIANQPDASQVEHLRRLCQAVLDPLREAVGAAISVTSGYRGPALNARIGGSPTSQHSLGQAADLQTTGMSVLELFKTVIRRGLPFDQLIYEARSASSKWVHVSHRAGANRGEIRVARFDASGRAVAYPPVGADEALAMAERATRSARGRAPGYEELPDEPVGEVDEAAAAPAGAGARRRSAAAPRAAATTPAAKVPAKRAATKTAAAKKAVGKAAAAKKSAPRKSAPRKSTPKKAAATKAAPKRAAAKKAAATEAATKRVAPKKAPAKKVAATPAAAKRAATKKTAARKTAVKKTAVK